MSDVRELLLSLQEDLRGARFDARAVRARGESRRRHQRALAAALALVLAAALLGTMRWVHLASPPPPTHPVPRGDGRIHVPGSVRALALDTATHTLYIGNPGSPGGHEAAAPDGVLVMDIRHCRAEDSSECTGGSVPMDSFPWDLAPSANGTLYAATWGRGVQLIDARTCNATDRSGCGTVASGPRPGPAAVGVAVDDTASTLWVASLDNPPSLDIVGFGAPLPSDHLPTSHLAGYDTRTCNVRDASGCRPTTSFALNGVVNAMTVDPSSHTLYVVAQTSDGRRTLWAARGNRLTQLADLGQDPTLDLSATAGLAVEQRLHTLYVTPAAGSTILVFDTRRCGVAASTCDVVTRARVGDGPNSIAVDDTTQTVYVLNGGDATISALDGRHCDAEVRTSCRSTSALLEPTGQPQSLQPSTLVVDPGNRTLYVAELAAGLVVPVAAAD